MEPASLTENKIAFTLDKIQELVKQSLSKLDSSSADVFQDMEALITLLEGIEGEQFRQVSDIKELRDNITFLPEKLQLRLALARPLKELTDQEVDFLADLVVDLDHTHAFSLLDRKASALHLCGRYKEAIRWFDEAITLFKPNAAILFRRAESKFKLELYLAAREDYEAAIILDSQAEGEKKLPAEILERLTLNLDACKEAEEGYLKVLAAAPEHFDARFRVATLYSKHSSSIVSLEKGLFYLENALSLEPDRLECHLELSRTYYNLLVQLDGDNRYAFNPATYKAHPKILLGEKAIQAKILDYAKKALLEVDWCVEQDGNHQESILLKGKILKFYGDVEHRKAKLGNFEGRNDLMERARKAADYLMKENSLMHQSIYKVEAILTNFRTLSPEDQHYQYQYMQQLFRKLFSNNPRYTSEHRRTLYQCLSDFCVSVGKVKAGINFVHKMIQSETGQGVDAQEYGKKLIAEYKLLQGGLSSHPAFPYYDEARDFLDIAVELNAKTEELLFCAAANLALAELASSEPEEQEEYQEDAFKLLQKARQSNPNSEATRLLLIDACLAQKQYGKASKLLKQTCQEFPATAALRERVRQVELCLKQSGRPPKHT